MFDVTNRPPVFRHLPGAPSITERLVYGKIVEKLDGTPWFNNLRGRTQSVERLEGE
jgi:hypothetical protein